MSRPYNTSFDDTRSPINTPGGLSPGGANVNFATNIHRNKSRRWVEAPKVDYGGGWGDDDEDEDEDDGYYEDEPLPPPRPAAQNRSFTAPPGGVLHRSNSFDRGDDAASPASAVAGGRTWGAEPAVPRLPPTPAELELQEQEIRRPPPLIQAKTMPQVPIIQVPSASSRPGSLGGAPNPRVPLPNSSERTMPPPPQQQRAMSPEQQRAVSPQQQRAMSPQQRVMTPEQQRAMSPQLRAVSPQQRAVSPQQRSPLSESVPPLLEQERIVPLERERVPPPLEQPTEKPLPPPKMAPAERPEPVQIKPDMTRHMRTGSFGNLDKPTPPLPFPEDRTLATISERSSIQSSPASPGGLPSPSPQESKWGKDLYSTPRYDDYEDYGYGDYGSTPTAQPGGYFPSQEQKRSFTTPLPVKQPEVQPPPTSKTPPAVTPTSPPQIIRPQDIYRRHQEALRLQSVDPAQPAMDPLSPSSDYRPDSSGIARGQSPIERPGLQTGAEVDDMRGPSPSSGRSTSRQSHGDTSEPELHSGSRSDSQDRSNPSALSVSPLAALPLPTVPGSPAYAGEEARPHSTWGDDILAGYGYDVNEQLPVATGPPVSNSAYSHDPPVRNNSTSSASSNNRHLANMVDSAFQREDVYMTPSSESSHTMTDDISPIISRKTSQQRKPTPGIPEESRQWPQVPEIAVPHVRPTIQTPSGADEASPGGDSMHHGIGTRSPSVYSNADTVRFNVSENIAGKMTEPTPISPDSSPDKDDLDKFIGELERANTPVFERSERTPSPSPGERSRQGSLAPPDAGGDRKSVGVFSLYDSYWQENEDADAPPPIQPKSPLRHSANLEPLRRQSCGPETLQVPSDAPPLIDRANPPPPPVQIHNQRNDLPSIPHTPVDSELMDMMATTSQFLNRADTATPTREALSLRDHDDVLRVKDDEREEVTQPPSAETISPEANLPSAPPVMSIMPTAQPEERAISTIASPIVTSPTSPIGPESEGLEVLHGPTKVPPREGERTSMESEFAKELVNQFSRPQTLMLKSTMPMPSGVQMMPPMPPLPHVKSEHPEMVNFEDEWDDEKKKDGAPEAEAALSAGPKREASNEALPDVSPVPTPAPEEKAQLLHDATGASAAPLATTDPHASSKPPPVFKDTHAIATLASPEERIAAYNATRDDLAKDDTHANLDEWLRWQLEHNNGQELLTSEIVTLRGRFAAGGLKKSKSRMGLGSFHVSSHREPDGHDERIGGERIGISSEAAKEKLGIVGRGVMKAGGEAGARVGGWMKKRVGRKKDGAGGGGSIGGGTGLYTKAPGQQSVASLASSHTNHTIATQRSETTPPPLPVQTQTQSHGQSQSYGQSQNQNQNQSQAPNHEQGPSHGRTPSQSLSNGQSLGHGQSQSQSNGYGHSRSQSQSQSEVQNQNAGDVSPIMPESRPSVVRYDSAPRLTLPKLETTSLGSLFGPNPILGFSDDTRQTTPSTFYRQEPEPTSASSPPVESSPPPQPFLNPLSAVSVAPSSAAPSSAGPHSTITTSNPTPVSATPQPPPSPPQHGERTDSGPRPSFPKRADSLRPQTASTVRAVTTAPATAEESKESEPEAPPPPPTAPPPPPPVVTEAEDNEPPSPIHDSDDDSLYASPKATPPHAPEDRITPVGSSSSRTPSPQPPPLRSYPSQPGPPTRPLMPDGYRAPSSSSSGSHHPPPQLSVFPPRSQQPPQQQQFRQEQPPPPQQQEQTGHRRAPSALKKTFAVFGGKRSRSPQGPLQLRPAQQQQPPPLQVNHVQPPTDIPPPPPPQQQVNHIQPSTNMPPPPPPQQQQQQQGYPPEKQQQRQQPVQQPPSQQKPEPPRPLQLQQQYQPQSNNPPPSSPPASIISSAESKDGKDGKKRSSLLDSLGMSRASSVSTQGQNSGAGGPSPLPSPLPPMQQQQTADNGKPPKRESLFKKMGSKIRDDNKDRGSHRKGFSMDMFGRSSGKASRNQSVSERERPPLSTSASSNARTISPAPGSMPAEQQQQQQHSNLLAKLARANQPFLTPSNTHEQQQQPNGSSSRSTAPTGSKFSSKLAQMGLGIGKPPPPPSQQQGYPPEKQQPQAVQYNPQQYAQQQQQQQQRQSPPRSPQLHGKAPMQHEAHPALRQQPYVAPLPDAHPGTRLPTHLDRASIHEAQLRPFQQQQQQQYQVPPPPPMPQQQQQGYPPEKQQQQQQGYPPEKQGYPPEKQQQPQQQPQDQARQNGFHQGAYYGPSTSPSPAVPAKDTGRRRGSSSAAAAPSSSSSPTPPKSGASASRRNRDHSPTPPPKGESSLRADSQQQQHQGRASPNSRRREQQQRERELPPSPPSKTTQRSLQPASSKQRSPRPSPVEEYHSTSSSSLLQQEQQQQQQQRLAESPPEEKIAIFKENPDSEIPQVVGGAGMRRGIDEFEADEKGLPKMSATAYPGQWEPDPEWYIG